MASVRDVANYLVRLYYYGNRNCTCAVIQKLLIIAQMRSLSINRVPLFEEDLLVKPSCFSVKIISNTYPDIIFDDNTRTFLVDDYDESKVSDVPTFDKSLPMLSSFYDIFEELNQQEINILNETYRAFSSFSGKCIGEFMKEMHLHTKKETFSNVSVREIQEYLDNIPESDVDNAIIRFVTA